MTSTEIRLASRPRGWPTLENFTAATVDLPAPGDNEVLVRNLYMSVDPYMRGRMNDVKSYVPPFQVGQALEGGAVGEVLESRAPALKPGDIVTSMRGWRDHFVAPASDLRAVDPQVRPLSAYLGVLGITGLTAWVGLKLADLTAGDRVFVSAAAGAVGSVAGQLARLRGCFVVGSAGSPEKVRLLTDEFGFDAGFNYRDPAKARGDHGSSRGVSALRAELMEAAPEGLDVYFDNVGGDHLEAALSCMRNHGRIVACGAISRYNEETPSPGPRNMFLIVTRRLTIRGFIVTDWIRETQAFLADVGPLVASGRLRVRETIVDGLEQAPQAFLDLLNGRNVGKAVVRI
jgi:NADPH-dependent curcumin reductase CurA